jgi:hypothetical protein
VEHEMAKRKYQIDERKVQKYLKEGRGQGSGAEYKPWIAIHDFPSVGRVHRIFGLTTGRIHHFMSDAEAKYFTQCDWDSEITDIREQFPLDRDRTYRQAKQAAIRHPVTIDGTPYILTTDFLLVSGAGVERRLIARTLKHESELNNPRVLEKFEIERRYWSEKGIDWGIVTEREIQDVLVRNVDAVRGFADLTGLRETAPGCYQKAAEMLMSLIGQGIPDTLAMVCKQIDKSWNYDPGTTLIAAKHLIAHKKISTDMNEPTIFEKRSFSAFWVGQEMRCSHGV